MRPAPIFASIAILVAAQGCTTTMRTSPQLKVPSPEEESIRQWQTANGITLSDKAFRLLLAEVEDPCANCSSSHHFRTGSGGVAGTDTSAQASAPPATGTEKIRDSAPVYTTAQRPWIPTGTIRKDLFEYYLDQLRDIKISGGRRVIEGSDVKSYPFSVFLQDLAKELGGDPFGPLGRLVVQSRPADGLIVINGEKKGHTEKRFVVKTGTYQVQVRDPRSRLSCEFAPVVIEESATEVLVCEAPH